MIHTPRTFINAFHFMGACIVFTGPARAQNITAGDLLAPVGWNSLQYSIADYIPWDTLLGAGVTWNYDWIEVDSATDANFTVIPLADAPAAGNYPDADRVVRWITGTADDYVTDKFYDVDGDRLLDLGSSGPVLTYDYDTPGLVYGLPMDLSMAESGDYCFWSDGFGIQYHFCGHIDAAFDAIGTLVLPYGTFTDVKHITWRSSSFETTEPSTDSSYAIKQQWFVAGVPAPVLEAIVAIGEDGTWYPSGWLMSQGSLLGIGEEPMAEDWSIAPNPTDGLITVHRTSAVASTVDVLALDGRTVLSRTLAAGDMTLALDLSGMPEGTYLVRMSGAGSISAQRILKVGGR